MVSIILYSHLPTNHYVSIAAPYVQGKKNTSIYVQDSRYIYIYDQMYMIICTYIYRYICIYT